MKQTATLFCIAAVGLVAKAASISGGASIDRNSVAAEGRLIFPRIPGLNAPLSSLFPTRTTTTSKPNNSTSTDSSSVSTTPSGKSSSPLSNIADLFDIPDPASLIPDLSSLGNSSDLEIPQIPGLPDITQLAKIPGLSNAIQSARDHVQEALQLGNDISSGIQQAVQEALESDDPTAAVRTIIRTIIDAYLTVAANCPLMIVGSRVIQEGIRLATEVAKSVGNVILGTTSSPV